MVVAASERAYTLLKRAFRDRTVDKTYHALVQGHPDPLSGTIDAPIGRHTSSDWRFAVTSDGKHSITHYDTLEAHQAATLVEVDLETGRTHQIRPLRRCIIVRGRPDLRRGSRSARDRAERQASTGTRFRASRHRCSVDFSSSYRRSPERAGHPAIGVSGSARSTLPVRALRAAGVGVLIVLALVMLLTALRTELPRSPGVMSDALGPDHGEPVAEYLDRAAASLGDDGAGGGVESNGGGGAGGARADDDHDDHGAHSASSAAHRWAPVSRLGRGPSRTPRPWPGTCWVRPMAGAGGRGRALVSEVVLTEPVAGSPPGPAMSWPGAGRRGFETDNADRSAAAGALTATRIRAGDPAIIG